MFKSTSSYLILLGVLAIIVGIIALAWPGVTVLALVILFAVDAFIGAGLQLARAFSSRTAGPVFGYLLLALAGLAAGVIALVWPGPTALVLVLVVGIWAFIGGCLEIFAAFGSGSALFTGFRRSRWASSCAGPGRWRTRSWIMRSEPAPGRAARPSGR
jgi:uncharacterized membrane protein HdeD (DUF308 family)